MQILPTDWEKAVSRSTGEIYYVNRVTGDSTYEHPATMAVQPNSVGSGAAVNTTVDMELPTGWEATVSQNTGQTYYVNTLSGEFTYLSLISRHALL